MNAASLKQDHVDALGATRLDPGEMNRSRLRVLSECSEEMLEMQNGHEELASVNAKRLGRKPRTALMQVLGGRLGIEDTAVPSLCLTGMPVVGTALESPFFLPHRIPAPMTLVELLATAERRRADALTARVRRPS